MRVFLSESVTGGGLADAELPPSLAREGRAMRDAVAADFARLPGVEVVLACDARIPPPNGVRAELVRTTAQEQTLFERLCRECDAAYIIAPELDGELTRRIRLAAGWSRRPLNAAPEAVELCSDKFSLFTTLRSAGVSTIETCLVDQTERWTDSCRLWCDAGGVVLKPRYGAGSQSIWGCRSIDDVRLHLHAFDAQRPLQQAILQPYIPGRPLSVAALIPGHNSIPQLFPVAEQCLSDDGAFVYRGGVIPAPDIRPAAMHDLAVQAAACVPGLRGYVGFDLIAPADLNVPCVLVEINPRLTTSYLGYRSMATTNLASVLLSPESAAEVEWKPGRVEFDPEGGVNYCELQRFG